MCKWRMSQVKDMISAMTPQRQRIILQITRSYYIIVILVHSWHISFYVCVSTNDIHF